MQDIQGEQGWMAQEELLSGSDAHFGHKRWAGAEKVWGGDENP